MKTTVLLGAVLLSAVSFGFERSELDAFLSDGTRQPLPKHWSPKTQALVKMGQVSHVEERLGVPSFFFSGQARGIGPSLRDSRVTPEEAARRYLFDHAELYQLAPNKLAEAHLNQVHDTGFGAVVVSFDRVEQGVAVFRDEIKVVMNQRLDLVALSGYLSTAGTHGPVKFLLRTETALATAFTDLTSELAASEAIYELADIKNDFRHLVLDPSGVRDGGPWLTEPARLKKVLYPLPHALVPAYWVELQVSSAARTDSDYYAYVISAVDGAILFRHNLTAADTYNYRVWADATAPFAPWDGPHGNDATPHPTGIPDGYQAPFLPPSMVSLQNGPISTQDAWLPTGAVETTGNNVEAYADITGPDGFNATIAADGGVGDIRATTTGLNTFDRVFDVNLAPDSSIDQRQAAITQLFYTINFLHDWYYDRGFDENGRNAQGFNYGRGGLENDSIKGEAEDSSGTNNANMSTPADGARPRMQQYVWSGSGARKVSITAPTSLVQDFVGGSAAWGAQSFDISADIVPVEDGVLVADGGVEQVLLPNGSVSHLGCGALYANAAALSGKIALVDRGTCNFSIKALNAQNNLAVGILIADNAVNAAPIGLGGTAPTVTIPAYGIRNVQGADLKAAAALGTVSGRMLRELVRNLDASIDSTIIAHEWAHYLSNRSIGNSVGLVNIQGRGMGEGWSDFNAMLMIVKESDAALTVNTNWSGVYGMASYSVSGKAPLGGGNDAFYYGIRRYPYSTDMSKDPLTFHHISDGVALPTGIANNDNGISNSEVHNSGEVWTTMLWESYAALLNDTQRLTFKQAQDRMMRYFVASLKATPMSPTVLEARDALLAVALATDIADYTLFVKAFAKRGAGPRAVGPDRDSSNNVPTVEDYTSGNNLVFVSGALADDAFYCDKDGFLDNGETGTFTVVLRNNGSGNLSATTATVTSPTPGISFDNGGVIAFAPSTPLTTTMGKLAVRLNGAATSLPIVLDVTFDDPQLAPGGTNSASLAFRGNIDDSPGVSAADDVEGISTPWVAGYDSTLYPGQQWGRIENDPSSHSWFVANPADTADVYLVSPALQVAATGDFSFTFNHRYDFEISPPSIFFDGGIIEISTDNGLTWSDIGSSVTPGYNATLYASGPNPLAGRPAFASRSAGYPAMIPVTVNLGTAYQGQTVQIRFRVGADNGGVGLGWELDDFAFSNIVNTPFSQSVGDKGVCINRPPKLNVATSLIADERTEVALDASGTTDPDGTPLSYTWTQLSGPVVVINDVATSHPTFTAPEVTADTELTFKVVVTDGLLFDEKDIKVLVKQVNRAPVANAGADFSIGEREVVTLLGVAQDPDGDPITVQWAQTAGPAVTLSSMSDAQPTFTALEVTQDTVLSFSLEVSDGTLTSTSSVNVTMKQVNRAPVVTLVASIDADERTLVVLPAQASDPDSDPVDYQWTQTNGPSVTLVSPNVANPTFTAPDVPADTTLTFHLSASDGDLITEASIDVVVHQVDRAPTVSLGDSFEVDERSEVTLTATVSDPDGDELIYRWTQLEGPEVDLGSDSEIHFVAPEVTADTPARFRVEVSDGQLGASADIQVVIKQVNRRPVAVAKGPASLGGGAVGHLWSIVSDPDKDPLTYVWAQTEGPTVEMTGADTAKVSFTAPMVKQDTQVTFSLVVSDGLLDSTPSTVSVKIAAPAVNQGCGCNGTGGALAPFALLALSCFMRRRRLS